MKDRQLMLADLRRRRDAAAAIGDHAEALVLNDRIRDRRMTISQELDRASIALSKHLELWNGVHSYGFVGCGQDELIVYIHCSKKKWRRRPCPTEFNGYPVKFRFNISPVAALDD